MYFGRVRLRERKRQELPLHIVLEVAFVRERGREEGPH
jgi:hypothetical protein